MGIGTAPLGVVGDGVTGLTSPQADATDLGTEISESFGGDEGLSNSFISRTLKGKFLGGHGSIKDSGISAGDDTSDVLPDEDLFFRPNLALSLPPVPFNGHSHAAPVVTCWPELALLFRPDVRKETNLFFSFSSQRLCLSTYLSVQMSSMSSLELTASLSVLTPEYSRQLGVTISLYSSFSSLGVNGTSGTTKLSMLNSVTFFFLFRLGVPGRLEVGEVSGELRDWLLFLRAVGYRKKD